ncbi:aldehyde dehydrogenase family protein [Microbacterium invictum]|uniref:Aldehyde dehydrogenase family protein n=1 Tax=Microbacterium invictum TaxID=515415 RepID=A0ABZ0VAG1_9MICO|nr:aldehyde dehydrogenase family protein [Microbacterium invictum]WQB70618.1 aldehyde dehydrogenase family protein [Microbacterium invictum]
MPAPDIDVALDDLREGSRAWTALTLSQRARLLGRVHATMSDTAPDWAAAAAQSKGLDPGHPLRGEEWLSGPYGAIELVDALTATLHRLAGGGNPLDGVRVGSAPGGRVRVAAFPLRPIDSVLLSGFTGEVWLKPGVTEAEARERAGLAQRSPGTPGGVGLVLGAGNVTSIPVADVLYELFAHNRVVMLKLNPTQEALLPVFTRALAPLIEPGFLRVIAGGPEVGAALTTHRGIDHVHITGSAATFERIVWGDGPQARRRRRENRPALKKPITAELGGVSPIIVVPGEWSAADIRFQAEHIATMRLQNAGHNCIAGQVVLISRDWPQRGQFLAALRGAYDRAPTRTSWYPGSAERMDAAAAAYPDALWCADGTRLLVQTEAGVVPGPIEETEYFAPVLGVISLPGVGQQFLDAAVAHANERLTGSLGANILIDPATEAALGDGVERALADLRYGAIAINAWTAFVFLTPTLTWSAFPGGTLQDVGSGIGIVHNALLLDDVERSVARGPFRPFPRSLSALVRGGRFSVLPKPPWFVSSRTGATVSEGFTRFRMHRRWPALAKTMLRAFRA